MCAWMNVFVAIFLFFVRERFYFFEKKLNIFAGYRTLCDQQADDEFSCTQKKNSLEKDKNDGEQVAANRRDDELN